MKNARPESKRIDSIASRKQKTLLPLVALGGSLAGLPAHALELGDLTVESRLGQPLRASIAFALAPNERLIDTCVTVGAGTPPSGLPGIGRATISIANGVILLTGQAPLREPMVAAHVVVDCAYTANLSREYMLFIDPPNSALDGQLADQTTNAAPASQSTTVAPPRQSTSVAPPRQSADVASRQAPSATKVNREPIGKSARYHVQPGDSLSRIAERIENRSIRLWPAVDAIFAANPDAFIDNDPNKLKAGSWLTIPSFDGSEPVVSVATTSSDAALADLFPPSSVLPPNEAPEIGQSADSETPPVQSVEAAPVNVTEVISGEPAELSPSDVILDPDNPFVDAGDTANNNVVIPDTELTGPRTISSSPNVPTAVINTTPEESSSSLLMWLAGSGLVMIIGLILFGRRFRERSGTPPMAMPDHRQMSQAGDDTIAVEGPIPPDLQVESPTEENLALDADLVVGTGLEGNSDMAVAQDIGFASPTELDIELPLNPQPDTRRDKLEDSILDSEILPDDEDYDLSIILDATKMPRPEDVTEQDLNAIEVGDDEIDTAASDNYTINTINTEIDLDILQQDYEDEFSATQALSEEMTRAAVDLAESLDMGAVDAETEVMPLATVTELDITAQMPARDEDTGDLDDTLFEGATVEMPVADNDDDTMEVVFDDSELDSKAR